MRKLRGRRFLRRRRRVSNISYITRPRPVMKWTHFYQRDIDVSWNNGWGNEENKFKDVDLLTSFAGWNDMCTALGNNYCYFIINKIQFVFDHLKKNSYYSTKLKTGTESMPDDLRQDVDGYRQPSALLYYISNSPFSNAGENLDSFYSENIKSVIFKPGNTKFKVTLYPRCKNRISFTKDQYEKDFRKVLTKMNADKNMIDYWKLWLGFAVPGKLPVKDAKNEFYQTIIAGRMRVYVHLTLTGQSVDIKM